MKKIPGGLGMCGVSGSRNKGRFSSWRCSGLEGLGIGEVGVEIGCACE